MERWQTNGNPSTDGYGHVSLRDTANPFSWIHWPPRRLPQRLLDSRGGARNSIAHGDGGCCLQRGQAERFS